MEYQNRQLENMVRYAYNHTKYYRRLFESIGFNPNVDSLRKYFPFIPITTKTEYTHNKNDFISDEFDIRNLETIRTSGSTGTVLSVYWNKSDYLKSAIDMWRDRSRFGINSQSRVCYFHTILKTNVGDGESVITSPKMFMPNSYTMTFSKMQFDCSSLEYYYRKMQEFRPEWLLCYPTTLYLFVEFMIKKGYKLPQSIRYIELMGESVLPYQKHLIQSFFGSNLPVRVLYGMRETNGLAVENDDKNMYVFSNNAFLEIETHGRVAKSGDYGNIIVTSLTNRAMPFIRYKTGDSGSLKPGNGKRDVLKIVNGRLNELVKCEGGETLESCIWFYIVEYINNIYNDCIKQFRVVQNDYTEFGVVLNITNRDFCTEIENTFVQQAEKYGIKAKWEFSYVGNIEPEENGKLRYFINNIP